LLLLNTRVQSCTALLMNFWQEAHLTGHYFPCIERSPHYSGAVCEQLYDNLREGTGRVEMNTPQVEVDGKPLTG